MDYYSSKIDWCEKNQNGFIVEYVNSVSNISFVLVPMYMYILYAEYDTPFFPFALEVLVGVTSYWFHSTLSLFGQLADELSILLIVLTGLPLEVRDKIKLFLLYGYLIVTYNKFNFLLLFSLVLPYISYLFEFLVFSVLHKLILRTFYIFCLALTCWVADRFWCSYTQQYYLHSLWHVLMAVVTYNLIILDLYIKHPSNKKICYTLGLPYLKRV